MKLRTVCPVCAGQPEPVFSCRYDEPSLNRVLARVPSAKAEIARHVFAVDWCPACNLYYQQLVMEDKDLAELYRTLGGIQDIVNEIAAQKLHWFAHMAEEILVMRQLLDRPCPKVLDFGSNWGKWSSMALAYGCDVHAVEVNPVAVEFCASRGIKVLDRSQLKAHRFDFINVDQVLEHVADPRGLAGELAHVLLPSGYMKWSVPGEKALPDKLRLAQRTRQFSVLEADELDALEPLVHINLFSNSALRALGRLVGLKPAQLPFFKWLGAGQLWNMPRQFGRNITLPHKRWRGRGTYLWFQHDETGGAACPGRMT